MLWNTWQSLCEHGVVSSDNVRLDTEFRVDLITYMHMHLASMHVLSGGQLLYAVQQFTPSVLTPCV